MLGCNIGLCISTKKSWIVCRNFFKKKRIKNKLKINLHLLFSKSNFRKEVGTDFKALARINFSFKLIILANLLRLCH